MWPALTLSAQDAVILCTHCVCYFEDPTGDIKTPNILDACLGESLSISFPPSCDGGLSVASLSDSCHFPPGSHLKSIRCHFVFYALTCTPVALAAPENTLRPFCTSFTVSSRGVSGEVYTWMIMESSTKQHPTRWKESREMMNLKTYPCPDSMRHFIRGDLTMDHISWAAPFPWPKPCGGGLSGITHTSPL